MERVKEATLLTFVNRAARDLANSGWLLPQEHAENIELLANQYEYDVPARFAYIQMLRLGDTTVDNASTVDTGTTVDEEVDTSETAIDVTDGSIFSINDLMQVDIEIMLITAITTNTLTVERGYFSTTAATHSSGASILRPHASTVFDYVIPPAIGPSTRNLIPLSRM